MTFVHDTACVLSHTCAHVMDDQRHMECELIEQVEMDSAVCNREGTAHGQRINAPRQLTSVRAAFHSSPSP